MYVTYGASVDGLRARGTPLRDIAAMVKHLPASAPVWVSVDPRAQYSQTEWMIADLIDAVRESNYLFRVANTDKKRAGTVKPPKPYPRPGRPVRARRPGVTLAAPTRSFNTPAEFDAWRASRLRPSAPGR